MVRDRIVDMEFQLFDENGIDLYNQTLNSFQFQIMTLMLIFIE